ncbi:hypothetical protein [Halorussus salinus]|uniref:hypothetical protein n=1 Tax=Halorussus salinus TaxID=1364935 RepID=UPI0010923A3B|nr:hypothetical protein [Halorussus salinus]
MTTLDSGFEDALRDAALDDVETTMREEVGPMFKQTARQNFEAYASRNDYDIDHIWQDATLSVDRDDSSVSVRVEWPELTALFEFGVSPHTIEGDPVLHFYYDRIDQWITTESVEWGSETGGIPESRAIRDAQNWLHREVNS